MKFNGAAGELFRCQNPRVLLEGPARTGKTTAAIVRTAHLCLHYLHSRHLWVRKTRRSMTQSVLQIWEEIAKPRDWITDARQRDGRSSYIMPGGAEIVIAGCDDPARIMSTEFDTITGFEATELSVNDYEMLVTRLSGDAMGWNQIVLDCNPGTPGHWLNQRANIGELVRLKSRLTDNPVIYADGKWTHRGARYRQEVLSRLTGVRRKRLLDGVWAAAEGLVYPKLPDCIVPAPASGKMAIPAVRSAGAIDWGWTDPTAVVIGVLSQDGVLRIIEEIYERKMPFDELARRVRELTIKWAVECYYCDPARADLIAQLRRLDIPAVANKVKQIQTGIAMVEQRVNSGRLEVWDSCTAVVREASEYEYAKDSTGVQTTVPEDANNHAMDALRYLVCGVDYGQPPAEPKQMDERTAMQAERVAAGRLALPDPEILRQQERQIVERRRLHVAMWGEE